MPRFRAAGTTLAMVSTRVVGSARVFGLERGVFVVLRMRRGKIAAMEIQVVFLLAVVGQRLARHLPARNASAISEHRQEERVDVGALLEDVQNLLHAFVQK